MKEKIIKIIIIGFFFISVATNTNATTIWLDKVDLTSGWHDVNKTGTDDIWLCWAAGASNMLSYTEWWGGPSLVTETQIFKTYKSYWNDAVGSPYFGVDWWFTGSNDKQGINGWAQLTDTSHTGFFSDALFNSNYSWKNYSSLNDIYSYIDKDWGTSIRISKENLGHILTVWGIDQENKKIWVTDSDLFDGNTDKTLEEYTINNDGTFTYRSNNWTINEVHGLSKNLKHVPPVPEPSSMVLIFTGIISFLLLERKKLYKNWLPRD